jgi:chromosome segregation ATPase
VRDIASKIHDAAERETALKSKALSHRDSIARTETQLTALDSQSGKQLNKLARLSGEVSRAWKWIQENQGEFEHPVLGPPLVSCSVKDPRYVDAVESMFGKNDMLMITTQSRNDAAKVSSQLYDVMKLAEVTIRTMPVGQRDTRQHTPPNKEQFGFEHWAIDLLDGPEPVLAVLASQYNLHSTGIALGDVTEEQFRSIERSSISNFAVGRHTYRIAKRREYGDGATSTTTKNIDAARFWTDQPVDGGEKRALQDKLATLEGEFGLMRTENQTIKREIEELSGQKTEIQGEAVSGQGRGCTNY